MKVNKYMRVFFFILLVAIIVASSYYILSNLLQDKKQQDEFENIVYDREMYYSNINVNVELYDSKNNTINNYLILENGIFLLNILYKNSIHPWTVKPIYQI